MKRFSEQLHTEAQKTRLRAAEKRALQERLVAYMEYHPLPKDRADAVPAGMVASEPFSLVRFNFSQIGSALGVFAAIVLIVVPVVAERAVPGDVLYPVKVQFNEEVRSTLSLSPYQKVEWETTRLERRIAEARLLASEGKLTDEVKSEVAAAVKVHSDAAQKEIAAIAESDTDEAAIAGITFNAALEVQSEVLETDTENGIANIEVADAVTAARVNASTTPAAKPSYAKLLARLETETTNATEFFNSITGVASPEDVSNIERRLSDIARKVDQAIALKAEVEEGDAKNTKAVALLTQALSDTRKLISFMTDIDVKTSVTIEELVPVTPTEAEEQTSIEADIVQALADLETVRTQTRNLDETDPVYEKVVFGIDIAQAAIAVASSSLSAGDLATAKTASTEALAVLSDLEIAVAAEGIEAVVPPVVELDTVSSTSAEVIGEVLDDAKLEAATSSLLETTRDI